MKHYYKIYYMYSQSKKIICRIYKGTHPAKTKEYKLCKDNFKKGFLYGYGFDQCTPEEVHNININKVLEVNNIESINVIETI